MIANKRFVRCGVFCLCFFLAAAVRAELMYQCTDENGHKTFSNVKPTAKGAKCFALELGPPATVSVPKAAPRVPTPSDFPKVGGAEQKSRDDERRRILEGELALEQGNLEQAKKALAEQESIRNGNEHNYQRVLDRLQPYKDKVQLHERNIEAIQKSIAKLP